MQNIDDTLIEQFLGTQFTGRRYLRYAELEALGLVDNRATLKLWMDARAFPRGIKIPGPYGKTLVWAAVEVVRLIAQRVAERDAASESNEGAPSEERPSDSNSPLQTGFYNWPPVPRVDSPSVPTLCQRFPPLSNALFILSVVVLASVPRHCAPWCGQRIPTAGPTPVPVFTSTSAKSTSVSPRTASLSVAQSRSGTG
jgi:hypothetical protein